jgi:hypothetical protein
LRGAGDGVGGDPQLRLGHTVGLGRVGLLRCHATTGAQLAPSPFSVAPVTGTSGSSTFPSPCPLLHRISHSPPLANWRKINFLQQLADSSPSVRRALSVAALPLLLSGRASHGMHGSSSTSLPLHVPDRYEAMADGDRSIHRTTSTRSMIQLPLPSLFL